ncbi:Por secretion system C-terminal sorting domain-containing protein [Zhouia amylolytica]|uniref:Por secretion system C-terminal sorting domain-containing protein n=1 Tax=Zhouia amylolytica TaxID=376730 RepID=A0A1I6VEJ4_9FLAO|nr:immunoglobulin domain-containing protein [Zhouia amylolytica]SFT11914.1 Por secretion system C-terminal sorting domain-containing protein [Zhouia amylolytica]
MKKLYFIFFSLITLSGFSQRLIPNGDFEYWSSTGVLSSWASVEGQVNPETNEVSHGSSSALFIDGTTTPKITSPGFILEAGETYRLTFDFKVKTANSTFGQQVIGYKYGPLDSYPLTSGSRIPQNFEWTSVEKTIEVTETKEWKFEISLFSFIDEPFEVFIDNIKLVNIKADQDKQALIALYNATNGPNWTTTWDLNADIRTWDGITVHPDERVRWIQLVNNQLSGSIPQEIENLTALELFNLNRNNLTGTVPDIFQNLIRLSSINLEINDLSGSLPTSIWSLTQLNGLRLRNNKFDGIIPEDIGNLSQLMYLSLSYNKFTGNFPQALWQLDQLRTLEIDGLWDLNDWQIPGDMNLPLLERFECQGCNATGTLPDVFDKIPNLSYITLSGSTISGPIPPTFSSLLKLRTLFAPGNNLSGLIPKINSPLIESITVSNNNFVFDDFSEVLGTSASFSYEGQARIGEEKSLQLDEGASINLTISETSDPDNVYQWRKNGVNIEGATNSELAFASITTSDTGIYDCIITNPNYPKLTLTNRSTTIKVYSENDINALIAFYNATGGPDWTTKWDITNKDLSKWYGVYFDENNRVSKIYLTNNNLNGTIPAEISDLSNLQELTLRGNQLAGAIPSTVSSLSNLEIVDLANNNYTGSLPEELSTIPAVKQIHLYRNNFTGTIPASYGTLATLEVLILSENELEGTIPESFKNLKSLTFLNIADNKLNGSYPLWSELSSLEYLKLKGNDFSGSIAFVESLPMLNHIDLSFNNFTGSPAALFNNTSLKNIDISYNDFDPYTIPESIQLLVNLEEINLSETNLEGTLPDVFDKLTLLNYFNIFSNNVSGPLPQTMSTLPNLRRLLVSNNNLSGTVPTIASVATNEYGYLLLSSNNYIFEDLEPIIDTYKNIEFSYYSQNNIDEVKEVNITKGDVFTLSVEATSSPNNNYQWRKDGIIIEGATAKSYTIPTVAASDSGKYDCVIKNSIATNLTLYKNAVTLNVIIPDSDGDGVNDEIDQCPGTPTGESVDTNGCSSSQLDDDNDGITNDIDQCPNTTAGDLVNENGCSLSQSLDISSTDIQVSVTSTSCPGIANGEIRISFAKNYNYTIALSSSSDSQTLTNITSDYTFTGLNANTYEICVTIPEYPEFKQCYHASVVTPEDLTSNKVAVDNNKKKATYTVSGSKEYTVKVNNKSYTITTPDTGSNEISIDLDEGSNSISIATDKICQGSYQDTIFVNGVTFYPNPATDYINIENLSDLDSVTITLTDTAGNVISSRSFQSKTDSYQLPLNTISSGMYLVIISSKSTTFTTKIFKK